MREVVTRGDICLNDEYNLTYKIAEIEYIEREDESFTYIIKPYYSVIRLLKADIFQGIPGVDLELKKESYVRDNIIPVFISERTPGKNREDLWKLLKENEMEYPNQLEWLIRTNTRYSGDRLYVQKPEDKTMEVSAFSSLGNRSAVICRKILEVICYGNDFISHTLKINDSNRKEYFDLLIALYGTERTYLDSRRNVAISKAAKNGKYKGRERIKIDKFEAQEIFLDYAANKISSTEAAGKLGISKSTFFRRLNEYDMFNFLINKIIKKKPYIYEINDGYYVLGEGCYKKISYNSLAGEYFSDYMIMMNDFATVNERLIKEVIEDKESCRLFKHVLNQAASYGIYDTKNNEIIKEMFENLSREELNYVFRQLLIFEKLHSLWWKCVTIS